MKKRIHMLKTTFMAIGLIFAATSFGFVTTAYSLPKISIKINAILPLKNLNLVQLAAVDLSKVLPRVMGNGDVFQGYETVNYKGHRAFKLRIFNKSSGRVRYVYIDSKTGRRL